MFDFIKTIGQSRLYNFHSHTQFCDGHATMEDFAAQVTKEGFTHYGFTPHSPVPIHSSCNMAESDVAIYLKEFERINDSFSGSSTKFYAGMEVDYLGAEWGPSQTYFHDLGLDYLIGSVHFIPNQDGEPVDIDGRYENFRRKMAEKFRGDIRYVVNTFYDQSLEMLSRGGFDLIGHYDKVGHNANHYKEGIEQEGWYIDRVDELTDAIISSGVTVEINTKARKDHRRFFPLQNHWRKLKEAGVPVIINSDAHWPELVNASRDEAIDLYRSL